MCPMRPVPMSRCWPRAWTARRRYRTAGNTLADWREAALFTDKIGCASFSATNLAAARMQDRDRPAKTGPIGPQFRDFCCPAGRGDAAMNAIAVPAYSGGTVFGRAAEGRSQTAGGKGRMGKDKRGMPRPQMPSSP